MGMDWYNMIAMKLGGYSKNWESVKEGISGEDIFEEQLKELLKKYPIALDTGCGHGNFTLKMAHFAENIIGFDFSIEMIKKANQLLEESQITNVQFYHLHAKNLPFQDEHFDIIYNRRGPLSIFREIRVLKNGGIIFGIHIGALDEIKNELKTNGFHSIEINEYNVNEYFSTEEDLARFFTRIPGNIDYLDSKNQPQLKNLVEAYQTNKGLMVPEKRFIWKAFKK
ncbi:class I SAM-dependent methyltransferase [Lederbergia citri]|uniref:Class I SAM-dependent methyltransferase n=1 Tax=Lederbergia citri TaxID=2833580 RepID=A0A942TD01_9BACI|nr:class I SAM-dependent methyltransferase [Lederbergia citri]MBS4194202.1 class I SAM-dependent methyltransferase [Lederbergia citri]